MKTTQKYAIRNADLVVSPEWLKKYDACSDGHEWALEKVGAGIPLAEFLPMFDRADWMLWTLRKADALEKVQYVRCAILCAESVLGIFEKKYPDDKRPRLAIEAAIRYVENPTDGNRNAAYDTYYDADAASFASACASAAADAFYAATFAADAIADACVASFAVSCDSAAADAFASASASADAFASAAASAAASASACADAFASASACVASESHHKKMCAGIRELLEVK